MEREKQNIEEMAEEIEALYCCKGYADDRGCYFANSCTSCKNANREKSIHIAEHLYNTGYRKETDVVKETVDKMAEMLKNRIKDKFSYYGWYLKETIIEELAKEIKGAEQ